jgi:alpha-amylase
VSTVEAPVAAEAPAKAKQVKHHEMNEPKDGFKSAIMMQGFGWDSHKHGIDGSWYNVIKANIPKMVEGKVTHVWLPPPSQSVAPQGYMPGQLYKLKSNYGNEEQLRECIKALKDAGIKPIADIVINHRCADEQDEHGNWVKFRDDVDHEGRNIDWGKWAITGDDPAFDGHGNADTGEDFHAAPDLDHANEGLRKALCDWLAWLQRDIGFEGLRFDYVKGYAANFIAEYVGASTGKEALNVGELWVDMDWQDGGLAYNQDGPRQALCNWIDGAQQHSTAFDFVTKGILQEAVKNTEYWRLRDPNNQAPGLIGWWPEMAVTFIDNHDTGSTQAHWPFPGDKAITGYAYLMTHPGVPCIFWEHYFDWGLKEQLDQMVQIRQRNGIDAGAKLEIFCADADLYMACINDKVVLKLGPRHDIGDLCPKECEGWHFAMAGTDFCIWEKK